jgi:hypothetical protein
MDVYDELNKVINKYIYQIDYYINFIDIKVKSENISKCKEHLEQLKKYAKLSVIEYKNKNNERGNNNEY